MKYFKRMYHQVVQLISNLFESPRSMLPFTSIFRAGYLNPIVLELKDSRYAGTVWSVKERLSYYTNVDSMGELYIPPGFITDLASVPLFLQWFIKRDGELLEASIIHDWLYDIDCAYDITREQADLIFMEAMLNTKVSKIKREWTYRLIRWFGFNRFRKSI